MPFLFFPLHEANFHASPQRLSQSDERIELDIGRLTFNPRDFRCAHAGPRGELGLVEAVLGPQFGDLHANVKTGKFLLHKIPHDRIFHLGVVITLKSIHDAGLAC